MVDAVGIPDGPIPIPVKTCWKMSRYSFFFFFFFGVVASTCDAGGFNVKIFYVGYCTMHMMVARQGTRVGYYRGGESSLVGTLKHSRREVLVSKIRPN